LTLLARHGARIAYSDPHVPRLAELELDSVNADGDFSVWDAVVIATDHSALDKERLLSEARLVVDARGALRGLPNRAGTIYGL
jgi:UDP-N-acetyl-D-mannosaminuronate dehydrogenase